MMRKLILTRGMRGVFVVAMATACFWATTNSYAQTDEDAVKAAMAAYNAAVDSLDLAKIESLWVHNDTVMDIEPALKDVGVGWDAVKTNLDKNFSFVTELKNTQVDGPHVQVKGDQARSMGIVMATYKLKNGAAGSGALFETDVFEKSSGAWLLVSHSATAVPK
jgi:ketosteroid isomerase-like protein